MERVCVQTCVCALTHAGADGSSREDFAAASEQLPLGDGGVGGSGRPVGGISAIAIASARALVMQ